MKLLEALIILVLIAVAAAGGVVELRALQAKDAEISQLQAAMARQGRADVAAAQLGEATYDAHVTSALRAGEAIARLAVLHARSNPAMQPMHSAADIRSAIQ